MDDKALEKHKKYALFGVVLVVVLGLLSWSLLTFSDNEAAALMSLRLNPPQVPIESVSDEQIVYTSDLSYPKEALINDCEFRDGEFDECGSVCEEGESCAAVCSYTCEF